MSFTINGKTYNTLDDMPPDVRTQWESMSGLLGDNNQNGVPDIMENMLNVGTTVMQTNKIIWEGKVYDSADQLPPEARAKYEQAMGKLADANKDGVPDALEHINLSTVGTTVLSANKIIYDGKTYDNVNDLPPEGRAKFQQAMGKLPDNNQNGVPDILENVLQTNPPVVTTQFSPTAPPRLALQTEQGANIGPLIVMGIVLLVLGIVVGIVLVLLLSHRGG